MHKQFRRLLEDATGISQYVIAIIIDVRGFTPFCQTVDSVDVATYIKKVYMKIIDNYFTDASFYKPTGDGLLVIVPYAEESIGELAENTVDSCLRLLEDFVDLCEGEAMINFSTPQEIGVGIARGSACCITSGDNILDYSGRILNPASRLMDFARPSGIVLDGNFGMDLLSDDKRDLFSNEDVYIRSIAELEPATVYYTKNYTLIPASAKIPIREPQWEKIDDEISFSDLKRAKGSYAIDLEKKPLNVDRMLLRMGYKVRKGFRTILDLTNSRGNVWSYDEVGRKREIAIYLDSLLEKLESVGELPLMQDETIISFEFQYPVK